ncbi:16S rRNA (guanine(527)-N(7))-methyltransferase RsmG [Candidatus Electronema sp. PJ]|uniref:16S rRNA (guanine(527)-N(7))-methyltransferase RsmG n=1 Tax=Candidatus Electronema sp. PJ TaxID=3401572 RepID=UPI003AA7F971
MRNRNQLLIGLAQLGLNLPACSVDKLLLYCDELQKWNKKINLLARDTPVEEIIEKHFLDSLTLLPLLTRPGSVGASLLDVGSGAGLPGLVVAVALPDLQVTLLEPRQKRTAFLRHIVRTLALTNVLVREERLEPGEKLATEFTFITSRAVAAPDILLPMLAQAVGPATRVILMQAADDRQFLASCPNWEFVESYQCQLPFSGHPRALTVVRKQPQSA